MNYLKILLVFAAAYLLNLVAPDVLEHLAPEQGPDAAIASTLWCISLFLGFGWACSYAAEGTIFPNFALQLLTGILLHDALVPVAAQIVPVVVICTALAAIILKCGGDDIEKRAFVRIAFPVVLIAIGGALVSFFVMYVFMTALGLDGKTAALLSAIICSTDPAALIPTMKQLLLKDQYKRVADLAIAESALNDAVGAIFTAAVAGLILAGGDVSSIGALTMGLMHVDTLLDLGRQFLFGTVAGLIGWAAMYRYEKYRLQNILHHTLDNSYDFAIVLVIPLATFLLAQSAGGNGFLAAFLAGLLGNYHHGRAYFHSTLRVMEVKIESIAKPVIFMMVGPFVTMSDLKETALTGFAISALFILLARPLAVMVSLLPASITLREKLFLSAVRETGVIPVVLSVITVAQFPELTLLMPLTAWVVIWTLTVLPAMTPWWAALTGVSSSGKPVLLAQADRVVAVHERH